MGAAKPVRPLTLGEGLALGREAPVKRRLVEGFPRAMAGASNRHNRGAPGSEGKHASPAQGVSPRRSYHLRAPMPMDMRHPLNPHPS